MTPPPRTGHHPNVHHRPGRGRRHCSSTNCCHYQSIDRGVRRWVVEAADGSRAVEETRRRAFLGPIIGEDQYNWPALAAVLPLAPPLPSLLLQPPTPKPHTFLASTKWCAWQVFRVGIDISRGSVCARVDWGRKASYKDLRGGEGLVSLYQMIGESFAIVLEIDFFFHFPGQTYYWGSNTHSLGVSLYKQNKLFDDMVATRPYSSTWSSNFGVPTHVNRLQIRRRACCPVFPI